MSLTEHNSILSAPPVGGLPISQAWTDRKNRSGGARGIAARGHIYIYMGAPIGVVEIHFCMGATRGGRHPRPPPPPPAPLYSATDKANCKSSSRFYSVLFFSEYTFNSDPEDEHFHFLPGNPKRPHTQFRSVSGLKISTENMYAKKDISVCLSIPYFMCV